MENPPRRYLLRGCPSRPRCLELKIIVTLSNAGAVVWLELGREIEEKMEIRKRKYINHRPVYSIGQKELYKEIK